MNSNPVLEIRRFIVDELKWETNDIFTLALLPEEGAAIPAFLPGQWMYIHALDKAGASLSKVAMSIASAPEESGEKLEFGIKVYGDRTKQLSQLIPGDVVGLQGPFGVFTLKEEMAPMTMFAAGIGITPFRSMIRSLFLRQATTDVTLFYSNKTVEDTAYFEEFREMQKTWPHLTLVFTCTLDAPNKWEYEFGRFSAAMVERHVADFTKGEFLACGPESFMQDMQALLAAHGVETKVRFRRESFG
jgi:ferredoxin-NADP reductase